MRWSDFFWGFRFVTRRLTDRAIYVLAEARHQAAARGHSHIDPQHVLLALTIVKPGACQMVLERLGIDLLRDREEIAAMVPAAIPRESTGKPSFSPTVKQLVEEARRSARALDFNYIGTEHLVLGLLRCGPCPAGDYLRARGVTEERFIEELEWFLLNRQA